VTGGFGTTLRLSVRLVFRTVFAYYLPVMTKRRLYPFPIESLIDHPDAIALPAAGFGILMRLSLHFWLTRCQLLPVADHELRGIGRAHPPTWRRWKPIVLKILEDIRPQLEAYYALREARRTALSIGAHATNAKRRAKALQSSPRAHDSLPDYASGFIPNREPTQPNRPRPSPAGRPARKLMVDRPTF